MGRYTSSCGDRSLWLTKEKHEAKQANLFSGGSLYIGTPVDELKSHCVGYAEK